MLIAKMHNKDIRPEWVPSAYRDDLKADEKAEVKIPAVKKSLYSGKGMHLKQGLKKKNVK